MQSKRAATPPTGVKKFKRLQNLPPPSSTHLESCFYLQNKPHSLRDPAPSADFSNPAHFGTSCPAPSNPTHVSFKTHHQNTNPAHRRALSLAQCSDPTHLRPALSLVSKF